MVDRTYDKSVLRVDGARIDWGSLGRQREPRRPVSSQLQLRWMISPRAGLPPEPFTVWVRRAKDAPTPIPIPEGSIFESATGRSMPAPMLTVEVDATPTSPGRPMVLWGFAGPPRPETAVAVSTVTSPVPATMQVRACGITYVSLIGGQIDAIRGYRVADAVNEDWEPIELVGLPLAYGQWGAGSQYRSDPQGPSGAPVRPAEAGIDRLDRGLAPFGWASSIAAGRPVPPWDPPDPRAYIEELQKRLLEPAGVLFAPGVPADKQKTKFGQYDLDGPGGQPSTANAPLLGAVLLAAGTDPAAALGLGFGTSYPFEGGWPVFGRDLMVTASYPLGRQGAGPDGEEFAGIVVWPDHDHAGPGAVTGLSTGRAGLLDPLDPARPWRETVRVGWDAVSPSLALGQPVSGALARYPSGAGPADLLLEADADAGGYHPLALTPREWPHNDQVSIVDRDGVELAMDTSPRTVGYAAAVQDIYGVWSDWQDTTHTSAAPRFPIPQVVSARLDASYAGSTTCPVSLTVDLVIDWGVREPATVALLGVLCPVGSSGAALPAGVTPLGAAPAGCVRWDTTVGVIGDTLADVGPDHWVYLEPDGSTSTVPGPGQGESRRYRITLTGHSLDFAVHGHYAVALWAREQTTAAPSLWGGTAATPVVAHCGSPVPPQVVITAPPVVPLGSMPDAAGSSHVRVAIPPVPGASKITVWSAGEITVHGTPDLHRPLPLRYQDLQNHYDALPAARQRAVFTREVTVPAGTTEVDLTLPRGSREIHLFAVTAVNAAEVPSAWPTSHDRLHAAAGPLLAHPTVPELSVVLAPSGATVDIEVCARSPLPVTAFEIYASRLREAARSVHTMGPPLATVAVIDPPTGNDAAGGPTYTTRLTGVPVTEDWRPLQLRAVAVPAPVDNDTGTYGARSQPSPVATVTVPPSTPPDLSGLTVTAWGDGALGIVTRFASTAPLPATEYGPHTLQVTARAGDAAPARFFTRGALAALPVDTAEPPASAAAGTLVRGKRAAGSTPYSAWFARPYLATAVDIEVVLTDPLGRVSVRNHHVPPAPLDPPTVSIVAARAIPGGFVAFAFTTNAPDSDAVGPYLLRIAAAPPRRFPFLPLDRDATVTAQFSLPDIRDADQYLHRPVRVDVVRTARNGALTTYAVTVRITAPANVSIAITSPQALTGTARVAIPAG